LKILKNEFVEKKEKRGKMTKTVKKRQKYKKDDAQENDIWYNCTIDSAQLVQRGFRKI